MENIIVEAKSRADLRAYALQIRKNIGHENRVYFPVIEFLEFMPDIFQDFYYEVVEDCEMDEQAHADMNIYNHQMRIKNSVYEGAYLGKGRDRMTIAHEIGHYLTLCVSGFRIARSFQKPKTYQNPEWQAKCFAGELLVPAHLVRNMDIFEVEEKCGVSFDAARYQLSVALPAKIIVVQAGILA